MDELIKEMKEMSKTILGLCEIIEKLVNISENQNEAINILAKNALKQKGISIEELQNMKEYS